MSRPSLFCAVVRSGTRYVAVNRWEQAAGVNADEVWFFGTYHDEETLNLYNTILASICNRGGIIHWMPLSRFQEQPPIPQNENSPRR